MTDRITFAGKVEAEGRRLRGSVVLTGSRTRRNGELLEVDPVALMKADASNVVATIDHDTTRVMGHTRNKTLTFSRTPDGIEFETGDLPNTTAANDALELARGGYFGGSSFAIDGLRSDFYADPDSGERVRRISSIKRLVDVSLVLDPAFANSTASAFSKENDDMTTPAIPEEPTAAPPVAPAPEEPKAKLSEQPKSGRDEWAAFAKDLSTEQITQTMDQVFAAAKGDLRGELLDRYEGFAQELQTRKRADADTKARAERMEALHNLRLGRVPKAPEVELYASDDYREAFKSFLRTGDARSLEQFAQSIAGDGTQGGYTAPDGFLQRIVETKAAYGGIQQIAEVITTSDGNNLRWPSNDDTANSAAIASEGSAVASGGADLVFGSISLDAYSYDATGTGNVPLLVSKELIQDSAFDVEAFVGRKLGQRLGRKMATDYATADGSSKPKGLFALTPDTMTATSLYAAFSEHVLQIDQEYRESGNCRWVFGDTTYAKVLDSVDLNGRPLFTPSAEAGGSNRPGGFILGYPVTFDQGAGSKVAFGDIRQAFIIRNVRGVQVDVDPYTNIKSRQLAFHAWARTDSDIQDSAAVSISEYSTVSADATA